jgi:hypothetical protein
MYQITWKGRPNGYIIYQHLLLQDPPKFAQISIIGLKTNHLATLLSAPLSELLSFMYCPNNIKLRQSCSRINVFQTGLRSSGNAWGCGVMGREIESCPSIGSNNGCGWKFKIKFKKLTGYPISPLFMYWQSRRHRPTACHRWNIDFNSNTRFLK